MARHYEIGGVKIYRRSIIKLAPEERKNFQTDGQTIIRRPVEWPLPDRVPAFERAYVDPGGTDLWGPGPYLKVPNRVEGEDDEAVNRVICPWGYPPDRIRLSRCPDYVQLTNVELAQDQSGAWTWLLTLARWPNVK